MFIKKKWVDSLIRKNIIISNKRMEDKRREGVVINYLPIKMACLINFLEF